MKKKTESLQVYELHVFTRHDGSFKWKCGSMPGSNQGLTTFLFHNGAPTMIPDSQIEKIELLSAPCPRGYLND